MSELETFIRKNVCSLSTEALDPLTFSLEADYEDLGLDSLDTIQLVVYIETEYNVIVPDKDAEALRSPQELLDLVKEKLNERAT